MKGKESTKAIVDFAKKCSMQVGGQNQVQGLHSKSLVEVDAKSTWVPLSGLGAELVKKCRQVWKTTKKKYEHHYIVLNVKLPFMMAFSLSIKVLKMSK